MVFIGFIFFSFLFVFNYIQKDTENHVTPSWNHVVSSAFQETFAELQAVGAAFQSVLLEELS